MTTAMNPKATQKLSRLLADFVYLNDANNCDVSGLTMDSRQVNNGDVFLACRSVNQREHGKIYASVAFEKGAAAVLVDVDHGQSLDVDMQSLQQRTGKPVIAVEHLDRKLGELASRFYGNPSALLNVVGVTGTNGKTSCTQFLAQALTDETTQCGLIGTLGNGLWGQLQHTLFTTPLALDVHRLLAQMQQQGARDVVMEVSSHGLEQGRTNAVSFDIAVLTNLSRDHLDYHGDMQAYKLAKQKLFHLPTLKSAVLNLDDSFGLELIDVLEPQVQCIGYSLSNESNPRCECVQGRILENNSRGMRIHITSPWGEGELVTHLIGQFNASNLLAVVSTLLAMQIPFTEILQRMTNVQAPAGRMERFASGAAMPTVVVDYAHTPDALEKVLITLRELCEGSLWVVFGCGGDRDKGKRPQMGAVAETYADYVVVTNDNPRTEDAAAIIEDVLAGIKSKSAIQVQMDRKLAIVDAVKKAAVNDVVLIAGKGHEDYQIIGKDRIHFSDREIVQQLMQEAA